LFTLVILGLFTEKFSRRISIHPVLSEISDFTSCAHAQSNILHIKYAEKTDG